MSRYGPKNYYNLGRIFPRTFTREPWRKKAHGPFQVAVYSNKKSGNASLQGKSRVIANGKITWLATASITSRASITASAKKDIKATILISASASLGGTGKYKAGANGVLKGITNVSPVAKLLIKATVAIVAKTVVAPPVTANLRGISKITATGTLAVFSTANLSGNTTIAAYFAIAKITANPKINASANVVGQFVGVLFKAKSSVVAVATMNAPYICGRNRYICTSRPYKIKKCYPMIFVVAEKTKYHQRPTGAFLPAITQCQQDEIIT